MPTVLRVEGHRFFFFSNEGNEPPHIHVETGENYAKFWLDPVEVADTEGYNAKELRRLRELVIQHRAQFEEKYHEFLGRP